MRSFPFGRSGKLADPRLAELLEFFVFQESGCAERIVEIFFDLSHLNLSRDPHQRRPQIQHRLLPVEARQARYQLGRDQ